MDRCTISRLKIERSFFKRGHDGLLPLEGVDMAAHYIGTDGIPRQLGFETGNHW